MTIEDIRRKHEGQKKIYTGTTLNAKANSILTTDDVDRLFAALDSLQKEYDQYKEMVGESLMKEVKRLDKALDEAKDGLTAAHMHGFEEGRDQYRDKVRKLQIALDDERGRVGLAKKLSDAVWEVHKKQSIWCDPKHPLIIPIEDMNKIFQARRDFDNACSEQILTGEG